MRHPEFPLVSFLSLFLLLCSLPSHIRAGSVATMALIAWLGTMSIIHGVNSIIWANNSTLKLEVWCDITTKITIGFTFAVPAAALCILRHLENVSSTRQARTTKADKRRRQKFEAVMCFAVPLIFMGLHYIVQGHRFDLFEDIGCAPTVYVSVAGLCLVYIPPLVMSSMTFVYAAMALRNFLRHRIEFETHLQNSHSAITPGRYFRLMAMAIVEMVWDTGVNAYVIYFNSFTGLRPWISWDNVHSNFSRVQLIPEALIPPEFKAQLLFQWWILPVSCVCFFIFFGFGEEAMSDYRFAINWFRRTILRQSIKARTPYHCTPSLPAYRPRPSNNVTLPSISDSIYNREQKPWDELSLKFPEISDNHSLPSSVNHSNAVTSLGPTISSVDLKYASIIPESSPFSSLKNIERPTSISSMASFETPTEYLSSPSLLNPSTPRVSTLVVPRPIGEIAFPDHVNSPSPVPIRTPPPAMRRDHPSNSSLHPTLRRSTSTDLEISVSEAYFPDGEDMNHREPHRGSPLPQPRPSYDYSQGGVQIIVEKSVA